MITVAHKMHPTNMAITSTIERVRSGVIPIDPYLQMKECNQMVFEIYCDIEE